MKWILIWAIMGWIDAPWWMWLLSALCCLIDTAAWFWRADNGRSKEM